MFIFIDPVPKPRQTRSDKWKKRPCVLRYRAYADYLRAQGMRCLFDAGSIHVEFFLKMPASWTKKKKSQMIYTPHRQKPDLDNLLKGFMDAVLDEDCGVCEVKTAKFWSDRGFVSVLNDCSES